MFQSLLLMTDFVQIPFLEGSGNCGLSLCQLYAKEEPYLLFNLPWPLNNFNHRCNCHTYLKFGTGKWKRMSRAYFLSMPKK